MKKKLLISVLMWMLCFGIYAQTTADWYVDVDASSGGDGTSWATAYSNLQIAINNSTNGDVIFVKKGEYPLTATIVLNVGPEIYGSFTGTETTLAERDLSNFSNDVANATVLKSNGSERVISINPGASPVFDGLVITGGGNVDKGGGMYVNNASPVLRNLIITANIASGSNGGSASNGGNGHGGGVYIAGSSSPSLINISISGNNATGGNGGSGSSTFDAINFVTTYKNGGKGGSAYGGGMYIANTSSPALTNVAIFGNNSNGGNGGASGGGLAGGDGGGAYGGGIYNANTSSSTLINVTLSGNKAIGGFSFISLSNMPSYGGGMFNESSALPKLYNTILLGNTATNNSGVFNDGTLVDIQYSLIEGETGGSNGNLNGTAYVDANIFNDAANGDYSLKNTSPAANAGNNTLYTEAGGDLNNDLDLAGNLRLYEGTPFADLIDMGAYELQRDPIAAISPDANNILYVNKSVSGGDESGNSWENAIPELADALVRTNSYYDNSWETNPLKIYVAKGTYKPIYSPEDGANFGTDQGRDNSFLMVNNVQLYGGFDPTNGIEALTDARILPSPDETDGTILSGDIGIENDASDNIYHVVLSVGSVGSALLDGFKITSGNQTDGNSLIKVNGVNVNQYLGAGMYNISSSSKIANVMLSGNSAKDYGGGMYNTGSSPVLSNVILSENSAGSAAGGMYNTGSSPILINVTLSGNSAFVDGGISIRSGSSLKLYNTIVAGNTASTSPNIGVDASTPDIKYSFIQGFNVGSNVLDGTIYDEGDIFTDPANGDYSLKNTSPAANAGSNTLYTEAGGNLNNDLDLAGNLRLYEGTPFADVIDMGAYELQRDPIAPISPDANNILYVNKSVSGGDESGNSWENAIPELADALVRTNSYYDNSWETNPLKIYVAKGTYKPIYSPEDGANFGTDQGRDNSFSMIKNVQLYGGFDPSNGIMALTDTRILPTSDQTVGTILSGDIGIENDASDNIYNILVSAGDMGTASLNGFSITGGNANAYSDLYVNGKQIFKCSGAGVYNSVSSPNYKNIILHNNICTESGGGMFSYMSSPKLELVTMKNNQAKDGGGMTNQESSSPTLLNVSIESNQASEKGSGMYNVDLSGPTLTNVSIVGNEATVASEEVPSCVSENSGITLNNSIIWDVVSGDYTAQNSLIKGSSATDNGNIDATGLVESDIFNDPSNGDYSLKYNSLAVNAGSNTLYTDAGGNLASDLDIEGHARLYDGLPSIDIIDIGAYEYLDNINPVFTSATTASFVENETGTVYTVTATDDNAITYSLGSTNDEALFNIDEAIGDVTFKTSPDFENPADANADNAYVINVIASDGINSANQEVTITVTNVDDTAPVFTSVIAVNFAENGIETAYTAAATDANAITYNLGSDNDEALFNIDEATGDVTFITTPDFENPTDANTDNAYVITVIANDGINTANQEVTITVTDVDEILPVFTSATAVDFVENGTGTAYTAAATDANVITYSLGNDNDEALFNIAASTGEVTFIAVPDFENPADANTDNAYIINVIANDGINTANQEVTITVTDVDEILPVFTSATAVDFAENGTGTAYTAAATDTNVITYSLGTANDESLFDIVGSTGVVTFKTAPDFENPADANNDNAYVITVIANDGINTANQEVTITVIDIDEIAPVFTSATAVDFAENGTGTAYTAAATDANEIAYSLGSDNDEALFNIAASTGEVTFITAPDFENPVDDNTDNAYVIQVIANDGINSANQEVTITVTDIDEIKPTVSINSSASAPVEEAFQVTITFSELVTGFTMDDLNLSNATVSDFSGTGNVYQVTISPQQNGTVTITVPSESAIDAAGNGNTAAEFSIEAVLTPLATNKLFDMQLKVSPNPATHFIRIEANQKIDSYHIIDMNGKLIKQLDATDTEIAIGDLSPGVYFLQASSKRHLQLVKFIKQ